MPRKNAQTDAPADTPTDVAATVDVGQSEVQAVADEATAKGYFGTGPVPELGVQPRVGSRVTVRR